MKRDISEISANKQIPTNANSGLKRNWNSGVFRSLTDIFKMVNCFSQVDASSPISNSILQPSDRVSKQFEKEVETKVFEIYKSNAEGEPFYCSTRIFGTNHKIKVFLLKRSIQAEEDGLI